MGRGGRGFPGFYFLPAISLMKWSKAKGEIAMDGNFRKKGHGCPFFPTRSARKDIPISLVKSGKKFSWEIPFRPAPYPPHFPSGKKHSPRELHIFSYSHISVFTTAPFYAITYMSQKIK